MPISNPIFFYLKQFYLSGEVTHQNIYPKTNRFRTYIKKNITEIKKLHKEKKLLWTMTDT